MINKLVFVLVLIISVSSCSNRSEKGSTAIIDLNKMHQAIEGFGASSGWTSPHMNDTLADAFFTVDKGIGLSLLRLRIAPDGTTLELETAKQAIARGASVWAAPWSPPAEWKDNNDVNNGGYLLAEHWQDWADRLASFAANLKAYGVHLIGISPQNEPGYIPDPPNSWETCQYTPESLATFIRNYLGPTLIRYGLEIPIITPETDGWNTFDSYVNALLSDSVATAYIGPVGTHSYSGEAHTLESVQKSGHVVWQTEFSDQSGGSKDTGMVSALKIAASIHADLVKGNVSAWHHWYFNPYQSGGNDGLTYDKKLTKRAWVIGNWSRFVRPGFVRIEATPSPNPDVLVSAFCDTTTNQQVIVLVNSGNRTKEQVLSVINGEIPTSFTVWITSDQLSLEQAKNISASANGTFEVELMPLSVTTLVSFMTDETL